MGRLVFGIPLFIVFGTISLVAIMCDEIQLPPPNQTTTGTQSTTATTSQSSAPYTAPIIFDIKAPDSGEAGAEIYVMEDVDSTPIKVIDGFSKIRVEDISPDGTKIVFSAQQPFKKSQVYIVDIDGSNLIPISANTNFVYEGGRFSPDGTQVSYYNNTVEGGVYTNDIEGGNEFGELQNTAGTSNIYNYFVGWIDSTSLIYINYQQNPLRYAFDQWQTTSHSKLKTYSEELKLYGSNQLLSPSKTKVAYTGFDGTIHYNLAIFNLQATGDAFSVKTSDGSSTQRYIPACWSSDSEILICYKSNENDTISNIYTLSVSTSDAPIELTSGTHVQVPFDFAPDDTRILFKSNEGNDPAEFSLYSLHTGTKDAIKLWDGLGEINNAIWADFQN